MTSSDSFPQEFGPFLLVKRLGAGGMAEAFLARSSSPRYPPIFVIKRLHASLASHDLTVSRFRHEAQIASMVRSPSVAAVIEAGRVGDDFYTAIEYVEGWTVGRILELLRTEKQQGSLESIVDLTVGILAGLEALHTVSDPSGESLGIIHRDITPRNVIVGEDGRVRLIDLGIARTVVQSWRTATGQTIGTPGYMSPEQVKGASIDLRTDLYSAGIILFELLTLEPFIPRGPLHKMLFAAQSPAFRPPSGFRLDASSEIDSVVRRALAHSPENRFQSAREFAEALRGIVPERANRSVTTLLNQVLFSELAESKAELTYIVSTRIPASEHAVTRFESFVVAPTLSLPAPAEAPAEAPESAAASWGRSMLARSREGLPPAVLYGLLILAGVLLGVVMMQLLR